MLYGNLIFIKKTGGDGSKYPVTEKNIKIGRSENCLIRIYNPQVAPEHCQLIIDSNGQAKLRNLFAPTILNGKPLGQGDVTLCHGDVFKLGERLARWEYLPTSKYFKQLLSPTGRLVAVVNPQRRSVEMPGTSGAQVLVSKSTPLGSKRKFSEKFCTESSSVTKQRKTVGLDASLKSKINLGKLLIGRHSIKTGKSIIKTPGVKQRKSVAGIINSRTPKNKVEKHRKSTLPSWKVSVDEQPKESTQIKKTPSKWVVKTPPKQNLKNEVRTPSKSTPIKVKLPKRPKLDSGDKKSLNTILESPPSKVESARSTRSYNKSPPAKVLSTPNRRSPVQAVRLVQSEKKPKSSLGTPVPNASRRKMSLILKRVDGGQRKSLLLTNRTSKKKSTKEMKIPPIENEPQAEVSSPISNMAGSRKSSRKGDDSPQKTLKESVESTTVKTPRKSSKPSNQNSVKNASIGIAQTPPLIDFSDEGDLVNLKQTFHDSVISSSKSLQKSVRKSCSRSADVSQKIFKKVSTLGPGKTEEEPSRSVIVSPTSTPLRSRRSGNVTSSKKVISSSKEKKVSSRGVRRRLSPSISSAERAAKKLKTSSPKKLDKNKRAALLVLGKANRKQLLSQNVKVLLKQKIVKKAIKQSVALPTRKDEKKEASVKKSRNAAPKKKKKSAEVSSPAITSHLVKESPASNKSFEKSINELENGAANDKKSPERSSLSKSKISSPVPLAKAPTPNAGSVQSPTKSNKKVESVLSTKSTNETISPFVNFDKSPESYVFSSSRRCSKRLSSKNDTERPDFVELSPTALGLIPKNIEIFKTPKERKRKSSSLVTPRNVVATGIIKSASTSKIGNRKSVSFSSRDLYANTTAYTPTLSEKTDFDFDSFHTSNITMDVFVSPLNKSSETPTFEFVTDENVEPPEKRRNTLGSKSVARKLLQSPQNDRKSKSSEFSAQMKTPRSNVTVSDIRKPGVNSKSRNSPKNDLNDVSGAKKLFDTPKVQRSPKNDLSNVRGVKKLMQTPKAQKSPKNDLSDLRGVKRLMRTPKKQKSPKNDLSDLRGVKKLLETPKAQKSPKNDLSDVRGVKKLMRTPKVQKSPKNDLSDVRGVKKLMRTPKAQKSPKNDLSDVRGVKKLMRTPKKQKSPKNDLSDLRGVKKLLETPKAQKSPKNDLSDLRGVKKLMKTPKKQKSPKNELTDLRGVKRLLQSPKNQKSPKNDLTDVTGVKQLLNTPKVEKSPKNNLSDLEGVAELFASPHKPISSTGVPRRMNKTSKGPKNYLFDVTGVRELFARHKPNSNYNVSLTGISELFENWSTEKETMLKLEEEKSLDVSETKTGRGRRRKVDDQKEQIVATSKAPARKGSAKVKSQRVTRSMKADTSDDVEEFSKRTAVGTKKITRARKAEPAKKVTRTRVESKKEVEPPKTEAAKTLRKRKPVEAIGVSPPKLRRKAAASEQSDLKAEESVEAKTVRVRPKTRKAEEKEETKSKKKGTVKSKTPAKKAQSKTSKSGVKLSTKAPKVQKARSQTGLKEESMKSGDNISPRKTRSVKAKNTSRKTRANVSGS